MPEYVVYIFLVGVLIVLLVVPYVVGRSRTIFEYQKYEKHFGYPKYPSMTLVYLTEGINIALIPSNIPYSFALDADVLAATDANDTTDRDADAALREFDDFIRSRRDREE